MQFSDGLTKPSARHVRPGVLKLAHDPLFETAKKKSSSQRAANVQSTTLYRRQTQVSAVCFLICLWPSPTKDLAPPTFHDRVDTCSSACVWQRVWWMIAALVSLTTLLPLFYHVTHRRMLSLGVREARPRSRRSKTSSTTMCEICVAHFLLFLTLPFSWCHAALPCQRNVCVFHFPMYVFRVANEAFP